MSRPRILHVVPSYAPAWRYGGPIRSIHELARHQVQRGHQVSVLTTSIDGPRDLDVPLQEPVLRDGVAVHYHRVTWPRRLHRAPPLRKAARQLVARHDVVHLHSVFLWPTLIAAREASRQNRPYLVSPRGMLVPELLAARGHLRKALWLRLFERRTLSGAAALHVTSRTERESLSALDIDVSRAHVLANGVHAPLLERPSSLPVPRAPDDPVHWLFLGRISWKKGLDRLIESLCDADQVQLTIAGPDEEGERARLQALASNLRVDDRICWAGAVDDAERDRLLLTHDGLVLPSIQENFGNVVLEAAAAARPSLVTPGVGAAELLVSNRAGLVVPRETSSLRAALFAPRDDPNAWRQMAERARALAAAHDWGTIAARMDAIYEEVSPRTFSPRSSSAPGSARVDARTVDA